MRLNFMLITIESVTYISGSDVVYNNYVLHLDT